MALGSSWIDRMWDKEPPEPVIGNRSGLTVTEKKILLAFAQGYETQEVAEMNKMGLATFERQPLGRLRLKLHAQDARRMVKLAYELGALELSGPPLEGVHVPELYLDVLLLVPDGYQNHEISEKLDRPLGTVRTHMGVLSTAFMVKRGMGGRSQLASRCFEFGIVPGAHVSTKPKAK